MKISVELYGNLISFSDAKKKTFEVEEGFSVAELLTRELSFLEGKIYAIALNNQMVSEMTQLKEGDEIALLPQFSGG